jgi:hypothetical protein
MKYIKLFTNKIIILNNNKYIPHHLHQLPKNYEEIPRSSQFNHKGFCYIESEEINWDNNKQSRYTNNFKIGGLATR